MDIVKGNMGWIEVVVGPMFSGKSEELIRRLRRAEIARQRVQIFKPIIDQRYSTNGIVSHSGLELASDLVRTAEDILEKVEPRTEVVGIDEGQFLGEGLLEVCTKMADLGKRVIVTGLDTDFMGRPFEPMPRLLAIAEEITKLLAICVRCGNPAVHTQRLVASEELIVVGAGGMYEARCRRCFEPQLATQKIEEGKKPPQRPRRARALCRASSGTNQVHGSFVRVPDVLLMDFSESCNLAMKLLGARPGIKRGPYVRMAASRSLQTVNRARPCSASIPTPVFPPPSPAVLAFRIIRARNSRANPRCSAQPITSSPVRRAGIFPAPAKQFINPRQTSLPSRRTKFALLICPHSSRHRRQSPAPNHGKASQYRTRPKTFHRRSPSRKLLRNRSHPQIIRQHHALKIQFLPQQIFHDAPR